MPYQFQSGIAELDQERRQVHQDEPLTIEELRQRLAPRVARCPRPHARYDRHASLPPWSDPQRRGEWHKSLAWVIEDQQAMLRGHSDVHGNHWCWQCFHRASLVDLGASLDYPRIAGSVLSLCEHNWLQETCSQVEMVEHNGMVGYHGHDAWMAVAMHGPRQVVADVLHAFRHQSSPAPFQVGMPK